MLALLLLVALLPLSRGFPPLSMQSLSSPRVDPDGYYQLVSRSSGKAIEVAGASRADDARVVQWSRTDAADQQFRFVSSGGGYYRVVARHSGKVLDVRSWSTANSAPVIQYTDRNTANQQWRLTGDGDYVRLINRHSGKALDLTSWSRSNGGGIAQYTDHGSANQQWALSRLPSAPATATGPPTTPTAPTTVPPTTAPTTVPPTTAPTTVPPTAAPTTVPPTTAPTTVPPTTVPPTTVPVTSTAPTTTTPGQPVQTECGDYASITQGAYWLNNNTWGKNSGTGSQCIWAVGTSGRTISWGTQWSWTGTSNSVKTYDSAVLGWHWGTKIPGAGLPVRLSAHRPVESTWKYTLSPQGPNTLDVSYDMWLHAIPNPTYADTPTDEVMVWLNRSGGAGPVGTKQATVTIDGTAWDLYRGNIGWNVFSFVRQQPSTDSTLNLSDFMDNLVARGWAQDSKYLTSVEAGTEVFTGTGRLDTTAYSTVVR